MADAVKVEPAAEARGRVMSDTTTLGNRTGSWKYIRPAYHDRVAPCLVACPAGSDVQGWMALASDGRLDEAAELLLRENPMPSVTGRVCDHPCEGACNRGFMDGAVAVHGVERALGDFILESPMPVPPPRSRSERIAVVGSGPAGLACGYHLVRLGYEVTVYEEAEEPGGMLRLGIPEYRLPRDVLDRQIARLEAEGLELRCDSRAGEDPSWDELAAYDAIFVGTGAHGSRALGVEGERLADVRPGLSFLREVNAGARPDLGARVVVVGGGNTAMDCARTAVRLGALEVVVLYRRGRDEMPAIAEEVEGAEREGVRFELLAAPLAFDAAGGRLAGVRCQRMRLGAPDADGRRRPEPTDEAPFYLAADTVLLATGETAELGWLPPDLERSGDVLLVDEAGATGSAHVFAGGDAAGGLRTVAAALGTGKRAAIGIDRYLRAKAGEDVPASLALLRPTGTGTPSMTRWRGDDPVRRVDPVDELATFELINPFHFEPAARHSEQHARRNGGDPFAEVNLGLAPLEALQEARRCLHCGVCDACEVCLTFCPDAAISRSDDGRFVVDLEHCKGCGLCAAECPRGAIVMTREGV